jgi:hypothetical protein
MNDRTWTIYYKSKRIAYVVAEGDTTGEQLTDITLWVKRVYSDKSIYDFELVKGCQAATHI